MEVKGYMSMLPHQQAAVHPAERIDRGATWSDPEVEELLNIWTNENVQAELKEATIKKHIFERIARNLREKGFFRTAEQCREKIKRLKKEYRQAKNNNYRCVRGRATVKFFPRLQAVLDGGRGPPSKIAFYDGPEFPPGDRDRDSGGVPFSFHGNHHPKASPHSFSECSAEEIKVDVNPAEVDNDSYVHSEPGEPDLEPAESVPVRSNRPPPLQASHWRHRPLHHPHSISHAHIPPLNQPITISIPHAHRNNNNNNNNNSGGGNNGVLIRPTPLGGLKHEREDDESEASISSRATSPSPMTPAPNSPSSPQLRRKKFKKNRCNLSTQAFKETLDFTLDRFLKHQRESEERLFAWEERRIQMELEAEERWRQEDREMMRQIFSQIHQVPANSQVSPLSGSQSNSSHDH